MCQDDAIRRFEELVANYGHVIRAAIRSVAGPLAARLGEDAEQQVLLELWKQVKKEQSIEYPSSYLYRAAVRETIRLARQLRRRSEDPLENTHAPDVNPNTNPERRALSSELSERLREVSATLRSDRRQAVLAHLAGYRVQEIMASYDWSYNRARNLIARGIADLRHALQEREP